MSEDVADVNTRQVAYDAMLAVKEARDIDDTDYALADAIHNALAALSSPETTPAGPDAELRAAIEAAFTGVRRQYVTPPDQGGDGSDAPIGDALNAAYHAVLAALPQPGEPTRARTL